MGRHGWEQNPRIENSIALSMSRTVWSVSLALGGRCYVSRFSTLLEPLDSGFTIELDGDQSTRSAWMP